MGIRVRFKNEPQQEPQQDTRQIEKSQPEQQSGGGKIHVVFNNPPVKNNAVETATQDQLRGWKRTRQLQQAAAKQTVIADQNRGIRRTMQTAQQGVDAYQRDVEDARSLWRQAQAAGGMQGASDDELARAAELEEAASAADERVAAQRGEIDANLRALQNLYNLYSQYAQDEDLSQMFALSAAAYDPSTWHKQQRDTSRLEQAGVFTAEMLDNFIRGGGSQGFSALFRLMEVPDDILYRITGNEVFHNTDRDSDVFRQQAAETAQRTQAGRDGLGRQLMQSAQAAGNMLFWNAVLGPAFGSVQQTPYFEGLDALANGNPLSTSPLARVGARVGVEILSNPGNVGISLGSAVSGYSDALERGATMDQAIAAGTLKGLAEYFSNKMFSGMPFEDNPAESGYVTQLIELVADKLGKSDQLRAFVKSTGGQALGWIVDKVGEGLEEVITGYLDPKIEQLTGNPDAANATLDSLAEEFVGGLLLSLIMTPGEALIENQRKAQYDADIGAGYADPDVVRALVEEGLSSERGTDSRALAEANAAALGVGQKLTPAQIGEQVRVNTEDITAEMQTEKADRERIATEPMAPRNDNVSEIAPETPENPLEQAAREMAAEETQSDPENATETQERAEAAQEEANRGTESTHHQSAAQTASPQGDAQTRATAQEQLAESAKNAKMGAEGTKTLVDMFDGADVADYFGAFAAWYNAGRSGSLATVSNEYVGKLSEAQAKAAWNAGRMDGMTEGAKKQTGARGVEDAAPYGKNAAKAAEAETPNDSEKETVAPETTPGYTEEKKLASGKLTPSEKVQGALIASTHYSIGGYEFTLTDAGSRNGEKQFIGKIRSTKNDRLGGAVTDARSAIYSGQPMARDDAIRDMISVAENNGLFSGTTTKKEETQNGAGVEEVSDAAGVQQPAARGAGDGGLLDELAPENVPSNGERGAESGGVLRPEGKRIRRSATRPDAAGDERGRSLGDREGRNLPAARAVSEQAEAETQQAAPETETQTVEEQTAEEIRVKDEEAVQEKPRGNNFVIPAKGLSLPNGEKARYKANIAAIKTLRTLMAEGRFATPEEQEILSKYVGWGGLANAFDANKEEWAKEFKQLKNLLSESEYKAARGSTLNAHYTDVGVIRGIYTGLEKLGFTGGRLLEPSAGVGHFAGAMPESLLPGVKSWTMVELDKLTGNIAKYLYPNADVRVQGFETAKIPDNYMDLAISNVPFGNYAISDKAYPRTVTSAIHNYFFAKALDKVRPGGLVTFITSRYTMDAQDSSVRQYIMKRADLLGAIRLPDSAFKGNAGTEVVTDILVLKKREPGTKYNGEAFENTGLYNRDLGIWEQTNEYYNQHPEMLLGTPSKSGSMYRSNSLTYKAKDTKASLQKQIEQAFSNINGKMDYPIRQTPEQVRQEIRKAGEKGKNGSIVKRNGKLYKVQDGELQESGISEKDTKRMESVIGIRDEGRALLDAQISGKGEGEIAIRRNNLNALYDEFVKKNGPLNKPTNARLIKQDSDFPFILALENYDKDSKTATKSAIFYKNTVSPNVTVTHVNTVEEGLTVVLNETGEVDVSRIAELTGESKQNVEKLLLDTGLVFLDRDGNPVTAEQYLSGNVKAKLRDAEALAEGNPEYQRNVDALKKIIPPDVAPEDIAVRLGVTWVPDSVYSDFAADMLGTVISYYNPRVTVKYNRLLGQFNVKINDVKLKDRPENISTWGTADKPFTKILEATLNNRSVTVWRKNADGSRILDKQATAAAQEKQEKVLAEFQKWIWQDEKLKNSLAKLYNDVFNNTVTPHYDGSNLIVNGANAEKPLRQHQKDAVQRIINSGGNTLLAHRVGAGKTYEMAAAAMKLRQLGIVKKPLFVVPKSLVAQWGNEFLDFFPAAKVLVTGENDFSTANRKTFANRIATGDYDAVIMSYEQFKAVPMSAESQEAFYQQQIDELEAAILEAAAQNGKRDPSVKQLEKSKKSLEAKLRKLGDMKKDAENIDFESLGVDSLFVDEAHNYKNLFYTTNMNNVAGLGNKNGSERAFDLYMKTRWLQKLNGGRGIVFATATPVMNSMSEMYIMQKYLQSDLLEARGLTSFDAWANQFGEVRTVLEMNPSGKGFRQKQSFSRFKNLAELQQMFRSFADVITEIPGLKIPTMKTGKRIIVESEPSDFQMQYIEKLAERADAIKKGRVDPKKDNMLKITSEGRKLSYTQRMIDSSLPYEDGNKIMKCAENVYNIWKESKDVKGTQLVFCDLSTPKGGSGAAEAADIGTQMANEALGIVDAEDISIYDDIKNVLVGQGIPANEIAFIHDANTDEKKAKLFADVNEGKVRVLIGSTGKMGVGMNAQRRMVALHHLDAPWRPGDIEQREGRALRQGNINDEVGVYVYVTKKTFDSRMWDNLQRKAGFIHQVMAGNLTARESEGDGDFALSAAEIKAISSGNPLIIEQFETAAEIAKLESLERAHTKEVNDARTKIEHNRAQIVSDGEYLKKLEKDISARQDTTGDKFKIVVNGKAISERKTAGEAVIAQAKKYLKIGDIAEQVHEIGKFAGFDLLVTSKGDLLLRGAAQYRTSVNMQSASGTIQSLEALPKRLDTLLSTTKTRMSEMQASLGKLETIAKSAFERADELAEARRRNAEIRAELNPVEDTAGAFDEGEDEDQLVDVQQETKKTDKTVQYSKDNGVSSHPEEWTAERVGGKNKKTMSTAEIVEKIRHDFGINITTGHIRGSGVRGQYDPHTQGIRERIAQDLPTLSHELGHHLDHLYDLADNAPDAAKRELVDNLSDEFKAQYPNKKKHPHEGVAEFLRRFLQNRETAAIDYPEFTKYFLNTLPGPDQARVEQLADEINAYYSLDADTAESSIRNKEDELPDARTTGEKIKAKASNFYQAWIDSNYGIKRYDEATGANAYKLATNAAYADAVAGAMITGDLYDANGAFVSPGLRACFTGNGKYLSDKKLYRLLGEYLVVKHGPERLAEGMRVFNDDKKNSTAWMNRRQLELEQEHPELVGISERLYEFQRKFLETWGVETGLVSEESFNEWGERWKYYVPFNRAVSAQQRGIGAKRGFANQNSTIKKAYGSGLDIINPVDNIITNMVKMVNAGIRNRVMQRITSAATQIGDALFLERVPTPMKKKTFNMEGVKKQLDEAGEKAESLGLFDQKASAAYDSIVENLDDILEQYGKGKAYGDVITVLVNGKQQFWKINDPLLLQSITNMSPKKMEGILDAYAQVSRFMTGNITGNNLLWSIFSNFPRDLGTFFTYSKVRNPVKVFAAMGSAYANKFKGDHADELYKEYLAMGGGGISAYTADRDLAKRARERLAGKKFSANPLDWIAFASDMIEMGPRFATYKLMRDAGMSQEEAFYEAMDITVNFRRGGRISREINKAVPFFNAGVQGLDKFARWITAQDTSKADRAKVARGRMIAFLAVSAALAAVFYGINNRDDESKKEYQQLSNYTKNSYFLIPVGDGKFFAIPKPRELAVLTSFFETCMEYGIGKNDYAFEEFYDYATDTILPNVASDLAKGDVFGAAGSLGILGVIAYLGANRDFLGKPIVSSGLQNLEPKDQYTARTSKIAAAVGRAFNMSPQKIDYFFSQVLGGWWKMQKALFPVGGENVDYTLGVQNQYIKDNQYSTDVVNRMYDYAEASKSAKNSDSGNTDKAIRAKMDDNMKTFYSRYYARAKEDDRTTSGRYTRQKVLEMILEYEKARDAGTTTPAERAVYDVIRKSTKGTPGDYLPSVMPNSVKDGNGTTRVLSDVQYVQYQLEYNELYWEIVEDSLGNAKTDAERAAIVRGAKEAAQERATSRLLHRIGAPVTSYDTQYQGISDKEFATWKALIDIANDDGSLKQSEVIEIIERMQRDMKLTDEDAYTLFRSKYTSDKNNPWA